MNQPAVGGKFEEELEEVRENARAYFSAQNRSVTKEDYLVRAYALPPQFGSIAKAFVFTQTFKYKLHLMMVVQPQTKSCKPIRYKFLLFRIRPIKKLIIK